MQVTEKHGALEKGDIRLLRRHRGVIAFQIDGVIIGAVFAHDHYHYEFRPRPEWADRFHSFSERTVREMKARLEGL